MTLKSRKSASTSSAETARRSNDRTGRIDLPPSPTFGRPPQRRGELTDFLRGQITRGILKPGDQLPTQAQLKSRFGASNDTVQSAIHTLRRQGFVIPRGRAGTVVAQSPPHLHHFAIVIEEARLPDQPLSRYHLAIMEEARRVQQASDARFSFYQLESGHTDAEEYQRLDADVMSDRLAGLFFTMPPFHLMGTRVLDGPNLPRVTVGGRQLFAHVNCISSRPETWLKRALDHLQQRGVRDVAFVALPPPLQESVHNALPAMLAARGMRSEPFWNLYSGLSNAVGVRNALHLLFQEGNSRRPQALVIMDDNLVEPATTGMARAGARAAGTGGDVHVVAMCNFPLPPASAVPVTRLGFDAGTLLRRAMNLITAQRLGRKTPGVTTFSPVFEHEWQADVARRASDVMS